MVTVAASVAFVVTWSSGFIIPAFATVDVSPLTLLVWRFVPLAVILLAVVLLTGAGRGVSGRDLRTQASIGVFAQFGYCVAVYGAVAAGIATGTVALIDAVQPLVVAVLVGPVLGLRVRGAQWVGLGSVRSACCSSCARSSGRLRRLPSPTCCRSSRWPA
ncbi:hypothetical protein GCM10009588_18440 [Microbacterium phyllosphaerae]